MTNYPDYLRTYPNMDSASPLHISLNHIPHGFRAHRHDFLEFSFVISGRGKERINDASHPMRPGTFTFVLPYQVHEIFTEPDEPLVLYNCMFSMDLLIESGQDDGLLAWMDHYDQQPSIQLDEDDLARMRLLIEDLAHEYNSDEVWKHTYIQIKLKEILIRFDRIRRKQGDLCTTTPTSTVKNNYVWPIIQYIHHHYQEELSLSGLSQKFTMSASRISELIKETTGQTFVHFLHDLRIRHAASLLVTTDMSVAEIALEVGYGSYNTFSRVFRSMKGIVPKEYRKRKLELRAEQRQ
ncbi:AraC family transcriptional regulator [Paenibacillus sp. 1001270B_150601_E10]|uniref:AraC family transcriptional regulator n=1 Tax=Paenibacillus sp. 1001270B_150601_E10 TaxID=2787079 RepID=UPI00189D54EC|nr:AraC family transcriptional regulator [Paenibacillus sp. 1001270B_150601_E10]